MGNLAAPLARLLGEDLGRLLTDDEEDDEETWKVGALTMGAAPRTLAKRAEVLGDLVDVAWRDDDALGGDSSIFPLSEEESDMVVWNNRILEKNY